MPPRIKPKPIPERSAAENEAVAKQLKSLAWLLDSSIPIPGTSLKIGLDGILGLLPVAGDTVSTLLSSYIVAQAVGMGVPKTVVARMGINVAIDAIVGSIPFVGDLFDFAFKANRRNVDLLMAYADRPQVTSRTSRWVVVLVFIVLVLVLLAVLYVVFTLLRFGWNWFFAQPAI